MKVGLHELGVHRRDVRHHRVLFRHCPRRLRTQAEQLGDVPEPQAMERNVRLEPAIHILAINKLPTGPLTLFHSQPISMTLVAVWEPFPLSSLLSFFHASALSTGFEVKDVALGGEKRPPSAWTDPPLVPKTAGRTVLGH